MILGVYRNAQKTDAFASDFEKVSVEKTTDMKKDKKDVISNEDVKRDDFPVSFRFAIVADS